MIECCESMTKQLAQFDGPIAKSYNGWIMGAYRLTASKKAISTKGRAHRKIDFCPFCGKRLEADDANPTSHTD